MIGTNIGILVYIVESIEKTSSSTIFTNLGEIEYFLGTFPLLVQMINTEFSTNNSHLSNDLADLYDITMQLNLLQDKLMSELSQWSYCESSKIVYEPIIPIWEFNTDSELLKYNLYDVLSQFIYHSQKLQANIISRNEYKEDAKWLMRNGISFVSHFIDKTYKSLSECEKNRISDISFVVNTLLAIGIIISALCLATLIYFTFSLKFIYEEFWLNLKKSAISHHTMIKSISIDRLLTIHGHDLTHDGTDYLKAPKPSNYSIKTTLAKDFVLRLSLLIIFSASFYLLMIFYFYRNCEISMINRPKFLQDFNKFRILLLQNEFYIKEHNDQGIRKYYPESYSICNPLKELSNILIAYKNTHNSMQSPELSNLISKDLKIEFYEKTTFPNNIMRYGLMNAYEMILLDAFYIKEDYSEDKYLDHLINVIELEKILFSSVNLVDSSAKEVIEGQLSLMIYLTIAFSAILGSLNLFYYLPYVRSQLNFIRKACLLPKTLMNWEENSKGEFIY